MSYDVFLLKVFSLHKIASFVNYGYRRTKNNNKDQSKIDRIYFCFPTVSHLFQVTCIIKNKYIISFLEGRTNHG